MPVTDADSSIRRRDPSDPPCVFSRLENNLVLAPMAGVSNLPFRLIAREAGAAHLASARP